MVLDANLSDDRFGLWSWCRFELSFNIAGQIGDAFVAGFSLTGNAGEVIAESHKPTVRFIDDRLSFMRHGFWEFGFENPIPWLG